MEKLSNFIHEQRLDNENWLILNLLNFNYMIIDESFSSASLSDISDEVKEELQDSGFLVDSGEEKQLFNQYAKELEEKIFRNFNQNADILDLLIVPTLSCNFRCSYCYQPYVFDRETRAETEFIHPLIVDELVDFYKNYPDISKKKIHLKVCGGEVFLDEEKAFTFIKNLVNKIKTIPVEEILFVTNGYYIEKFLPFLSEFEGRIIYSITIDGPKKIHNSRRFLENGEGTYEKIIENIKLLVDTTEHYISIRTNFDEDNTSHYTKFLDDLKNRGLLKSSQISLYYRSVYDYSDYESKDKGIPIPIVRNRKEIIYTVLDLIFSKQYQFNFRGAPGIIPLILGDLLLGERLGSEPNTYSNPLNMFCSAKQGVFSSIDYKGTLFPCSANSAESLGQISPLFVYNKTIPEKWLSIDFNKKEFYKEPCNSCKYFFMCSLRQCPYTTFATYDENKKFCTEIYEIIYHFLEYFGEKIWLNV